MATINIKVTGQYLKLEGSPVVPSGGFEFDSVKFIIDPLDETWKGVTLAGAFCLKNNKAYYRIFSGDLCKVPHEVLREGGTIYIGLIGTQTLIENGKETVQVVRSSEVIRLVIRDGAISSNWKGLNPTPDTFTQAMQLLGGLTEAGEALKKSEELLTETQALNGQINEVKEQHGQVVTMHKEVTDAKKDFDPKYDDFGIKYTDFVPKYDDFDKRKKDFDPKYTEINTKHGEVVNAHDVIVGPDGLGGAKKEVLDAKGEAAESLRQTNIAKNDVITMKSEIERIYQDASEGGIFGVDFNMQTGAAVRLGAAKNLSFHKYVGNGSSVQVKSDFEGIGPWGNIYQTLRTVEGNKLVARSGDSSFESDLRSGQYNVFTHIPRYYVSTSSPMLDGAPHWIINVSTKPFKDAICLFDRSAIELGSCVTSLENGKHVSKPNLVPLVNATGTTFETTAKAQGLYVSGWRDFLIWWLLMLVETANLNSQEGVAYGVGSTLKSWGGADLKVVEARSNSNEVVMGKWSTYTPGMTVHIGAASSSWYSGNIGVRRIVKVDPHPSNGEWVVLTVDGDPITTAVGDWCSGCGQITSDDALIAMGTKCGEYRYTETSSSWTHHAFVYGISDPWGNVFQFTEGYAKYDNKVYLSKERENYPKSFPAEGWDEAADFPWIAEGYPSAWEIKQNRNNISLVPTAMGGSSGKLFGDYLWGAADGIRVPWRGGNFYNSAYAGALSLYMRVVDPTTLYYGSRLLYLPE